MSTLKLLADDELILEHREAAVNLHTTVLEHLRQGASTTAVIAINVAGERRAQAERELLSRLQRAAEADGT